MRIRALGHASALLAVLTYWLQRYQVLLLFGWRYTDEDQALLAFILKDVQAGAVHAPTFYGQSYGNWIESAVAALFTPASVSPMFTLPIATQLLFWLPFAALGLIEWRAGRRLGACVLLWLPCLMPHRADLLFALPRAWLPGVSLAMLGATLLRSRPLLLGAIMVCAVTLNSAAGLLAVPVLVEAVLRERHQFRFLGRLVCGLALGACIRSPSACSMRSIPDGRFIVLQPGTGPQRGCLRGSAPTEHRSGSCCIPRLCSWSRPSSWVGSGHLRSPRSPCASRPRWDRWASKKSGTVVRRSSFRTNGPTSPCPTSAPGCCGWPWRISDGFPAQLARSQPRRVWPFCCWSPDSSPGRPDAPTSSGLKSNSRVIRPSGHAKSLT